MPLYLLVFSKYARVSTLQHTPTSFKFNLTSLMTLRTLTLLLGLASSAICSDLSGLYQHDVSTAVEKTASEKSEAKTDKKKTSRLLELNKDQTLRFATKGKGKILDYQQYQGAWAESNGRVFYYMESYGEHRYVTIGSCILKKSDDSLSLEKSVGIPILRSMDPEFKTVESLEFPFELEPQKTTQMKADLAEIINNIPDVKFEGAATEEEFIKAFHTAIKAEDISSLMKLTNPQPNKNISDLRLHYYLKYVSDFKGEGVYEVGSSDDKEIDKYHKMFPANYAVKGHLKMSKTVGTSTVGSYWFYGVVNGRWCLVGNPKKL